MQSIIIGRGREEMGFYLTVDFRVVNLMLDFNFMDCM